MSILEQAETPSDGPIIVTVCADAGVGKSNLGAEFPYPIFLRIEDGMGSIPLEKRPKALPLITKTDDIFSQLMALYKEPHRYGTAVIDSVTAFNRMVEAEVSAADNNRPLNKAFGGYGAGRDMVAAKHRRLRKAAEMLRRDRGMHVLFLAHAETETIDPPDADSYTRYSLQMHHKSQPPYVEDVDMVAFMRLETNIMGKDEERKKAVSDGSREIISYATAANISKNRFGITQPIPYKMGTNPFLPYITILSQDTRKAVVAGAVASVETQKEDA